MRDFTAVVRSLRKSPGFTAAVILTLALAIGANTVIFSAVEAVILHPFPVRGVDRLVTVGGSDPAVGAHYGLNPAEVYDLEKRPDLFDAVAGYRGIDVNVTGSGDPRRAAAVVTTAGFFRVFTVHPYLGRLYDEGDEQSGATHVIVLSYDFWRTLTGGDEQAVGRTLQVDDSSFTLIGVLPPGFSYPVGVDLWTPRPLDGLLDRRAGQTTQYGGLIVPTVARMRVGMTLPRLQSALTAALRTWAERLPEIYSTRVLYPIEARPLATTWAGKLRSILLVLVGAVALVLLIACANVATLQLLRTTGRAREIAVRTALGASRWAIVRLFVVESAVLAMVGGVLGVVVGQFLIATVGRVAAATVPEIHDLGLDPIVLGCSASATVLAALLFGVGPAIHATRGKPRDVLNATTTRNASAGRARNRLLHGAIVAQVAIALMLLLSCGITIRSLFRLLEVDPGFDPVGVVTARVVLPPARYPMIDLATARRALITHEELLHRLRAVPGFEIVGMADVTPFGYRGALDAAIHRIAITRESGADAGRHAIPANMWRVDADYFRAMRIPLLKGAAFTGNEQADWLRDYPNGGQTPVLIDEALAHRLFGDEDPIGKAISPPYFRVVGVVGTVRKSELTPTLDDVGAIYYPNAGTLGEATVVVRSSLPFGQSAERLRAAVREYDPELPLFDVAPLSDLVGRSTGSRRIAAWLLAALAGLSLVLALLGIHAVLSYATSQRTKEIGIRVALGASPREVVGMIVRRCATLTGAGLLIGALGYLALERALSSLTYGVSPNDPVTVVAAVGLLAAAALLASLPAAARATRINPIDAVRSE